MKSLGSIIDEFKGNRQIYISLHDLSTEKTDELQMLLGKEFVRDDKIHQRIKGNCPPYQRTSFNRYNVLGFRAVHIDVYRDEVTSKNKIKRGGENSEN